MTFQMSFIETKLSMTVVLSKDVMPLHVGSLGSVSPQDTTDIDVLVIHIIQVS